MQIAMLGTRDMKINICKRLTVQLGRETNAINFY